MKKIRIISILLLACLTLSLFAPTAAALDDPQVDSSHAVVLLAEKGSSETVLYTKNEHERLYPASLTKVMTVLLALEAVESGRVRMSDPVTALPGFDFDMIIGGSSVYIANGETMTLENLLYCAMIASANDACNVIAEYVGGTISGFVDMMNARAAELGCTETHFTNTHGLPDDDHYTTAWDFGRILKEACSHEVFMDICDTINYTVPGTNMSAERRLENTNSLINPTNPLYPGDYGYEYARGVKTGHTDAAGYCLATAAVKDDVTLLAVIMNSDSYEMEDGSTYYGHFADARTLFEWAFNNFSFREILKSTEIILEMPVDMGAEADTVAIRPSSSISALLPNDANMDDFVRSVTVYDTAHGDGNTLLAPVTAGQEVGEISVALNGRVYGTVRLVTSTGVDLSRVQFMKDQLSETLRRPAVVITFWALVLLFLTYLLAVIRYRMKRRSYQKRLEAARQIRLDLEEDEEERRRAKKIRTAPRKNQVSMEPDSYRKKHAPPVDEPTRVSGEIPGVSGDTVVIPDKAGTENAEKPADGEEPPRDYFEEFFGKK